MHKGLPKRKEELSILILYKTVAATLALAYMQNTFNQNHVEGNFQNNFFSTAFYQNSYCYL